MINKSIHFPDFYEVLPKLKFIALLGVFLLFSSIPHCVSLQRCSRDAADLSMQQRCSRNIVCTDAACSKAANPIGLPRAFDEQR
jgi:hypothetical protein